MMRVIFLIGIIAFVSPLHAQTASPSVSPSLEQRIADLEAYVNNSGRGADTSSSMASNIGGPGPGHNAWMMTCAALVLFMTLPGLALFYGGLVRAKNVLSVLAQCLSIAGLVTILWWAVGYSLVFSRGSPFIGGLKFAFLHGVDARPNSDYSYWASQDVFAMYQLMFAIITPALIIGIAAGILPFFACTKLKSWLGYDDALDTFGIHAVGGTLGAFLTGIFATASVNPNLSLSTAGSLNPATQNGLARIVDHALWIEQLKAIAITILLAVVGSALIGALVRGVIGLRIPPENERQGLDTNQHGEEGYIT